MIRADVVDKGSVWSIKAGHGRYEWDMVNKGGRGR